MNLYSNKRCKASNIMKTRYVVYCIPTVMNAALCNNFVYAVDIGIKTIPPLQQK